MSALISGQLEEEWEREMHLIYCDANQQCGYKATYFRQMVSELGGTNAAHILLLDPNFSDVLIELWNRDRLDLTMEARMFQRDQQGDTKWQTLFTLDEFEIARRRLTDLSYPPAVSGSL